MTAALDLQQKIRAAIPLSAAMEFSIEALSLDAIRVTAPLQPNVNIHGSGFAGSIYSVAVLTGWALCTHILDQYQIDAELVVAKAEIKYRTPVTTDLECNVNVAVAARELFLQGIREQGKGRLLLDIEVGDLPQAVLQATFYAVTRAGKE
jgi:thioesterase domain-containing protein